jgi:hypothetical protein
MSLLLNIVVSRWSLDRKTLLVGSWQLKNLCRPVGLTNSSYMPCFSRCLIISAEWPSDQTVFIVIYLIFMFVFNDYITLLCRFLGSVYTDIDINHRRIISEEPKGFWVWSITHRITGFMDFSHPRDFWLENGVSETGWLGPTLTLCGAEYHSRGHKLCSYSVVPSILWNPKVHYRVYKSSPPVPILRQTNSVHNIQSYLWEDHLNVIYPPTSRSS